MSNQKDKHAYTFAYTPAYEPQMLRKTWELRTLFPPPYSTDLIKSRPPFMRGHMISEQQAAAHLQYYFPGLAKRTGYNISIFGCKPCKHLIYIYELEAFLQSDWEPMPVHILAGMNHFGQRMQDMIDIVQQPVTLDNAKDTPAYNGIVNTYAKFKRLIIFLVRDLPREQHMLCWYDQKHVCIYLIDSHPYGFKSLPENRVGHLERTVRSYLSRAGCALPARGIIPIENTSQVSMRTGSGLHVMNNLRMLLHENNELIVARPCSGYVDWPNSLVYRSDDIPFMEAKEDMVKYMMITTCKMEMGSKGRPLRWPEHPELDSVSHHEYSRLDARSPLGAIYQSNYSLCPARADLEEISIEDVAAVGGEETRSVSAMAGRCYGFSAAPSVRVGSTVRGTSELPPSRPGSQAPMSMPRTDHNLMARIGSLDIQPPGGSMMPPEHRPRKDNTKGQRFMMAREQDDSTDPYSHSNRSSVSNQRLTRNARDGSERQRSIWSSSEQGPARDQQRNTQSELRDAPLPGQSSPAQSQQSIQAGRGSERRSQQPMGPPPPPRGRGGHDTSNRHNPYPQRPYTFRSAKSRDIPRPPENPGWDDTWDEVGDRVVRPNVDDNFNGWEYEMRLDRWGWEHTR